MKRNVFKFNHGVPSTEESTGHKLTFTHALAVSSSSLAVGSSEIYALPLNNFYFLFFFIFFYLQINCLHDNYSRYSYLHYLQKKKKEKKKLLTNQLLALLTGQLLT